MPTQPPAPFVALGDGLAHGMHSMGVAALSQAVSYSMQIADFLGVPFRQPILLGELHFRDPYLTR
jgi:hypothetical protein